MSETSTFTGMSAVIAEDSQHMRTLLRSMLYALGFEQVSAESNGDDALRQIQIELPDVVLLDWNMPGLSGIEMAQTIKKMPDPFCRIPTMIITAHASPTRLDQAKTLGVDALLCKPLSILALETRLRKIMSEAWVRPNLPAAHQPKKTSRSEVSSELGTSDQNTKGDTELESFYV